MNYIELIDSQKFLLKSQVTKSVSFRKNSLKKLLKNININEEQIYQSLKKDLNKPEYESYITEVYVIKKEIKTMLKNINRWSKIKNIKSSIINFPSKDYIIPEPYGTTLLISPWNYPFQLALGPLIGAVASGNTVILKPSEHAENTSRLVEKIITDSFNKNHVCVILGDSKVATELLSNRWDYIFFTGSTNVGKIIAKAAAIHLTPYTLELGGKNPCIVDKTIPIKLTAKRIIWGKFLNCGQTCIAPDFIIAHSSIIKALSNELIIEIKNAFGNNPIESKSYGRIINTKHIVRLEKMLQNVNIIHGGTVNCETKYIEPTIVLEPSLSSELMKVEIFGPILPIISYDTDEDLDIILNKYEKPLGFYIFSKRNSFIKKIQLKYSFGGGVANDTIIQFTNDKLTFGGVGHSGMGSYHGKFSFDLFTHYKPFIKKSLWLDLWVRYAPYPVKFKLIKKILNKI